MLKVKNLGKIEALLCVLLVTGMAVTGASRAQANESATTIELQQEQQVMELNDLHEIDLKALSKDSGVSSEGTSQKPDDVVSGVVWLSKKIAHGTVVAAKVTYKHVLKPIGQNAVEMLKGAADGTVYVVASVKKGALKVNRVIVKGSEVVYKDALAPIGQLALVDGVYGMVLYPTGQFFVGAAQQDVVTGVVDTAKAEKKDAKKLAKDAANDGKVIYRVVIYPAYNNVLKPVGEAVDTAITDTALAVGWLTCEYVQSYKTSPVTCTFSESEPVSSPPAGNQSTVQSPPAQSVPTNQGSCVQTAYGCLAQGNCPTGLFNYNGVCFTGTPNNTYPYGYYQ